MPCSLRADIGSTINASNLAFAARGEGGTIPWVCLYRACGTWYEAGGTNAWECAFLYLISGWSTHRPYDAMLAHPVSDTLIAYAAIPLISVLGTLLPS
eukprot:1612930-Rhodomonas_salina.4